MTIWRWLVGWDDAPLKGLLGSDAKPSYPDEDEDEGYADDLPSELERAAAQGVSRVQVDPELLVTAAAALRVLSREVQAR